MHPIISICVPSLNRRPFLSERLETIFIQTFQDWELIVVDNYSDDGAWEFFQEQARRDKRIRVSQAPREGLYANFNNCIRQARGEYVYMATNDDTMAPDCLEKLVAALASQPDCDLAHCSLRAIGDGAEKMNKWWAKYSLFAQSSAELMNRPHIRRAPFDGLLQLYGENVYIAINQVLIRRSLFGRIGLFDGRWGSVGDFHWYMKASLIANTVHVPDTWCGWRQHPGQATANAGCGTPEHRQKIEEMIDDAIRSVSAALPPKLKDCLEASWRNYFKGLWLFQKEIQLLPTRFSRAIFLFKHMAGGSNAAWCYFGKRLKSLLGCNESPDKIVAKWLESVGIRNSIVPE
jgi:glycosyl transferase family 2